MSIASDNETPSMVSPPASAIQLPILETDGSIRVVSIPQMSETAFSFLKDLLDRYERAIVRSDLTPAKDDGTDLRRGDREEIKKLERIMDDIEAEAGLR